jgi:anti-anti-sigma factor
MALEIKQEEQGALKILTLVGRLDTETAPDFELAAHDLFEAGGRQFVVDLGSISYVSSAGLRVLLALAKKVEGQGAMRLSSLQPVVKEVFDKSGFARLFQIFPRIDAAVASLGGSAGAAAPAPAPAPAPANLGRTAADLLGVRPSAAPAPAPAPARAPAPPPAKSGGFWAWLKGLFGKR